MRLLCVIAFAAVAVFYPVESRRGHCNSASADGCSIPFDLPYFYKSLFTPSCVAHDVCYDCGARFGVSRSSCDSRFLSNIKYDCSTVSNSASRIWCNAVTYDYWTGVRVGGASRYSDSAMSYCSQSWVSDCIA